MTTSLTLKTVLSNACIRSDGHGNETRAVRSCCARLQAPAQLTEAASGKARTFDVCMANILRGPLLKIAPRLARHVRPGGWLALSGILEGEQAAEVCRTYEAAGFGDLEVANGEGWSLITGRRQTL